MSETERRIQIARALFWAWSSGDPDAPEQFFMPDGVLEDNVSGRFETWPAIRAFFSSGLSRTRDLTLVPFSIWTNDDGVALAYEMSAEVINPAQFGPEYVGRRWSVHAMSYLRFDGDRIAYEADFHERGGRARSLGIG